MKRAILTASLIILVVGGAAWGKDVKKPATGKQVIKKNEIAAPSTAVSKKKNTTQSGTLHKVTRIK